MSLDDVRRENKEEDIKVGSLVVSELNQTVVCQQDVALLILESNVAVSLIDQNRKLIHEIVLLLDLF